MKCIPRSINEHFSCASGYVTWKTIQYFSYIKAFDERAACKTCRFSRTQACCDLVLSNNICLADRPSQNTSTSCERGCLVTDRSATFLKNIAKKYVCSYQKYNIQRTTFASEFAKDKKGNKESIRVRAEHETKAVLISV